MSLDIIKLPPIIIQNLYKKSLVLSNDYPATDIEIPNVTASLSMLGNNKQRILILVANNESLYLPDEELTFLTDILSACKLTIQDVAILNIYKNENNSYAFITKALLVDKILLFGIKTSEIMLALELSNYIIQSYNNQILVAAPPLSILKNDKTEKTKLWHLLKQLFLN